MPWGPSAARLGRRHQVDRSRLVVSPRAISPWRIAVVAACAGALMLLMARTWARAYTFGQPSVRATGPEVLQFDYTAQQCASDDIPDQPTRAFRDVTGQVVLVNSHHTTRRWAGPSLAGVTHS